MSVAWGKDNLHTVVQLGWISNLAYGRFITGIKHHHHLWTHILILTTICMQEIMVNIDCSSDCVVWTASCVVWTAGNLPLQSAATSHIHTVTWQLLADNKSQITRTCLQGKLRRCDVVRVAQSDIFPPRQMSDRRSKSEGSIIKILQHFCRKWAIML